MTMTGGCLCGAVRFETEASGEVGVCHCGQCRRWASGPWLSVQCENVRFEGEENLARYASSDWAERGFCKRCGSNLFYRILKDPFCMLAAGTFDDQSRFHLTHQVFIDEKPAYYDFAQETRTSVGDDFFVRRLGRRRQ